MSGEWMSPTPKTTFRRAAARFGHLTQTSARARNSAIAASFAFASGESAGDAGRGEAGGSSIGNAPPRPGGADGIETDRLGTGVITAAAAGCPRGIRANAASVSG
ncbi:MAG TPA: hypothetical protein VGK40_03575 [Verrucomicrobiae bacterium]